jgi:hypothetical protein
MVRFRGRVGGGCKSRSGNGRDGGGGRQQECLSERDVVNAISSVERLIKGQAAQALGSGGVGEGKVGVGAEVAKVEGIGTGTGKEGRRGRGLTGEALERKMACIEAARRKLMIDGLIDWVCDAEKGHVQQEGEVEVERPVKKQRLEWTKPLLSSMVDINEGQVTSVGPLDPKALMRKDGDDKENGVVAAAAQTHDGCLPAPAS